MSSRHLVLGCSAAVLLGRSAAAQSTPPNSLPLIAARPATADVGVKGFVPVGSVRVIGWDRDSIVVRGHVGKNSGFYLAKGDSKSSYKLGVEPRQIDGQLLPSTLVIYLPRRASIALKSVDASITAENVGGWFYSVGGAIRVSGATPNVDIESIRGDIVIDLAASVVKARTGRGHLVVRGSPEDVDASTVEGPLVIETTSILRGRFASVTGDIRYTAAPVAGSVFEFSDHAGTIELDLPRSTSSRLELSTVTGSIQNGFPQVRPASGNANTMTVRLGAGEAHFTARTFRGAIRVLPR